MARMRQFRIGGSKVVRQSAADQLTIVAAGVTLFEALKAHDQLKAAGITTRVVDLYSIVPVDRATLLDCVRHRRTIPDGRRPLCARRHRRCRIERPGLGRCAGAQVGCSGHSAQRKTG
jgi:hypothetical protein